MKDWKTSACGGLAGVFAIVGEMWPDNKVWATPLSGFFISFGLFLSKDAGTH